MASALRSLAGVAFSALGLLLLIVSLAEALMGEEILAFAFFGASLIFTLLSWLIMRGATASAMPVIRSFPVSTEITCEACGLREVRAFSRGDYILKHVGKCPRCGGERIITSIFREEGEKATSEESL